MFSGFGSGVVIGWYWCGLGKNTCGEPCRTEDDAKAQATVWYREYVKAQKAKATP
jgi:hypothetical protein